MISQGTKKKGLIDPSRRQFCQLFGLSLLASLSTSCSKKSKSKHHISRFKDREGIQAFLKNKDNLQTAYSGLAEVISLKVKPEDFNGEEVQIARLWLLEDMMSKNLITFEQATDDQSRKNLARAIAKIEKVKLSPLEGRINDNYSPLSYAFFRYLKASINTVPKQLKGLIEAIGENHHHLPVVSANKLPDVIEIALGYRRGMIGTDYAKVLYATLFMISALEIGSTCNQPARCGIHHGQYSGLRLITGLWPKQKGDSAFGYYQMIQETFERLAKTIEKRTEQRLDFRDPVAQVMTAALLIHEKFTEYFTNQNKDINQAVNQILAARDGKTMEGLVDFLAQIDHPVWAALSTDNAKASATFNSIQTTKRGALFLRGLEIAGYQID